MADDLSKRGEPDRSRINLDDAHELRYWSDALGVDEDVLRRAVAAVGVRALAVRAYLTRNDQLAQVPRGPAPSDANSG